MQTKSSPTDIFKYSTHHINLYSPLTRRQQYTQTRGQQDTAKRSENNTLVIQAHKTTLERLFTNSTAID